MYSNTILFYNLLTLEILIINLIPFFFEAYEYSPEEIFNYFNKQRLSYQDYEEIINLISETLEDVYAFNELSKNPPQPQNYNTYFNPVNIQERLKQINISNITKYEFFQNITKIFSDLKDPLISISWNMTDLDQFYFFEPLDFYIKEKDGYPKIYGKCNINRNTMKYFNDGNRLYELALKKEDIPIDNINGYKAIDFFENFGGNYMSRKNAHSTFNYKIRNDHNKMSLKFYPLKYENFKNFKIIYEDGEIIEVDYIFLSNLQMYEGEDDDPIFNPPFGNNNLENDDWGKKDINDIKMNSHILNEDNNLLWNFYYFNYFKCLSDDKNQVNVYYIHSLSPEEGDNKEFIDVIINCYKLFDNNTYPIVVINDINTNGDLQIAQLLLNIISPLYSFNIYGTMKINDNLTDINDANSVINHFADINNCSVINYSYLIANKTEIKYSTNNKVNLSRPFILKKNKTIISEIEKAKKYMKNKRKPTEILILTDATSISLGSILIKYFKKSGAAIIAGYMGNPSKTEPYFFDSSESNSIPFSSKEINFFSKSHKILEEKYYFKFESLPAIQIFFDYNINNIPLEYELGLVDEKIEIYEVFDKYNYQRFINESKNIFEKYKNNCNYNNKKLLNISELCDGTFENNHTHGGFECEYNGKWSLNCVPSYCDKGYIFDQYIKKCVEDPCLNIQEEEFEEEEKQEERFNEEEKEFEGKENKEKENIKEENNEEETIEEEFKEKEIKEDEFKEEEFKEEKFKEEEYREEENKEEEIKDLEKLEEESIDYSKLVWSNIIIVAIASVTLSLIGIIICYKSKYCCFRQKKKNKKNRNKILNSDSTGLFQSIID